MKRALRMCGAVAAMAVPVSVMSFALAGTASAQPPGSYSVVCTKLSINLSANTSEVKKCAPASGSWTSAQKKEYKDATGGAASLATGGSVTWHSGGGTTTISSPVLTEPGCTNGKGATAPNNCATADPTATGPATGCKAPKKGYVELVVANGTVTATSGVQPAKSGDDFQAEVCESSTGSITPAKGADVYM